MNDTHELELHSLAFGGDAVGRLPSGKAVFVRGAAPGEVVRVVITEEKRSFARAAIESIVVPSPDRIEPVCDEAASCGGCTWMHLPVEVQRRWKRELLTRELRRAELAERLDDVVPGAPLGYRTRCRLHLRRGQLGTLAARSNDLVPLNRCPVLSPDLEQFALELCDALLLSRIGAAIELELYVDIEGRRGLHVAYLEQVTLERWRDVASDLDVSSLCITPFKAKRRSSIDPVAGVSARPLHERSLGVSLAFEPGVFVQANRELNRRLVEEVIARAGTGKRFAEVYAGVGNFTVHLARSFDSGIAYESSKPAVELLRGNLSSLPAVVKAHALDDKIAAQQLRALPEIDLLVADPPRAGMRLLRPFFASRAPRRVVMASCHPMTAVRDLTHLREAGYRVVEVLALDLFPQTYHVELVALLER